MNYFPTVCDCGAVKEVTIDDVGEYLRCSCGGAIRVPRILKDTRELIQSLVASGKLPSNSRCPYSSEAANTKVCFKIRRKRIEDLFFLSMVWGVLFGWVFILLAFRRDEDELAERRKNPSQANTSLELPIHISSSSLKHLRGAPQRDLIRILRTVPIYAYLIDEYGSVHVEASF